MTLIACMAAIPLGAGMRKSAFITKFENAKKMFRSFVKSSAAAVKTW